MNKSKESRTTQPQGVTLDLESHITATDISKAEFIQFKDVLLFQIVSFPTRYGKRYNLIALTGYVLGCAKARRGEVARYLRTINKELLATIMNKYTPEEIKDKFGM